MARVSIVLVLLAIGCGGGASSAPPPTTPKAAEPKPSSTMRGDDAPPPKATAEPPAPVEVNTKDAPVLRCGPLDSYKYVSGEFKCQDGSNPFHGDPALGRNARLGNVGANAQGHIIDLYEVPCPEGPRRVYVDMYGCSAPPPTGGSKI